MRFFLVSFFALAAALSLSLSLPTSATHAQPSSATERLTLVVEIVARDDTPVTPCGIHGATPRDVTARVIQVEEGAFPADQILLSWPVCTIGQLVVGARHRVQIRRYVDRPADATTRYRVRRSWAVPGA
ncbi:MAG: hypothetical protein U0234_30950 [Sandaracinus sp.]